MRIAFNATSLLSPLTGIGHYCQQLAMGLSNHADVEADFFYGAVWDKQVRHTPLPGAAGLIPWVRSHVPYSYALRRWVQNSRFSQHTQEKAFDLYHEPNILPLPFGGPTVITVHDLSWIRYPQAHPPERVRAMNTYFEPALSRASLILTDSEFVKTELIDVFGVDPVRIRPVLLGVDALFHPRSVVETRSVLSALGLVHQQYLLAVGTLEPRKNLALALRAFMLLPPRLRKQFPLVLVGMKGWNTSELERQLAPLVAAGEVRQLGYLPRGDLAAVIAGAVALVYPSIYEGFGLPPLEAMACGVPAITSNVSSIPEVVGDTGLMVHPQDTQGLAQAMQLLVEAPEVRQGLAQKALARSAQFTWAHCVDQTIDAYRRVLSSS